MKTLTHGFKFLAGDVNWVDCGGKWYRLVDGRRYHVVEFLNFEDAGCWEKGQARYNVDLSEVDLDRVDADAMARALDGAGPGRDSEYAGDPLAQVESCHGYGIKAPLWQLSSNNAHKLLRAAARESARLTSDADAYDYAFRGTMVNRIGESAEEYAYGRRKLG